MDENLIIRLPGVAFYLFRTYRAKFGILPPPNRLSYTRRLLIERALSARFYRTNSEFARKRIFRENEIRT